MRKMMLLAVMMAIAAMMLAAAPAAAQTTTLLSSDNRDGFCDNDDDDHDGREECEDIVVFFPFFNDFDEFCEDFDENFFCDDEERFLFDGGITQETEQEAESGDIDQSFDVSQTGDNSNQTVGIQGVANTGNAQNVIDVVDAGNFGDFDNNNNGNDGFVFCDFDNDGRDDGHDECEDFNDGVIICDFDGDGDNDECEDFNNNDGLVFCDRDNDGKDDGDDECFVIFPPFFDFDDGDRFFVNGNDDGDIEFEDVGATIELSPTNTVDSHQEVNQAAAASTNWWM
jgi:hypothetical protein